MPPEWLKIRPFNGSQNDAFEELCCQLFSQEPQQSGSRWVRKGKPDSGLEGFWALPNGDEEGIQCKYVFEMEKTQLKQLDESIKTALESHPRLTKYIICIPFDLPDGRYKGVTTARQKYDKRASMWSSWAKAMEINVTFVLWDSSELWSYKRLLKPENAGMIKYWFDEHFLTMDWFRDRFEETKANVAKRYQPQKHVHTEIEDAFSGLLLSESFRSDFIKHAKSVIHAYANLQLDELIIDSDVKTAFQATWSHNSTSLLTIADDIQDTANIPTTQYRKAINGIAESLRAMFIALSQKKRESELEPGKHSHNLVNDLQSQITRGFALLADIDEAIRDLIDFLESGSATMAEKSIAIIKGDGGIGKTHLMCRMVDQQIEHFKPALLFLGGAFHADNILKQMREQLELEAYSNSEFLGALEVASIAHKSKIFIAIDAINDSTDTNTWLSGVMGVIQKIKKYPHLTLVLTIRSGTEGYFLPKEVYEEVVTRYHNGFSEVSDKEIGLFFSGYGLETPSIPLLRPDYNNPLFLHIICETISNQGLKRLPEGHQGIMSLMENYLDGKNNEFIAKYKRDTRVQYVQKALSLLAQRMAENGAETILRDKAKNLVMQVDSNGSNSDFASTLFGFLILSGILRETPYWSETERTNVGGIGFMFQRFTDHLIAEALLKDYKTTDEVVHALQTAEPFKKLWMHKGWYGGGSTLVSALAVQLPEKYDGLEILDYAPLEAKDSTSSRYYEAFLESLIWREPSAYSDKTFEWIDEIFYSGENWADRVFEYTLIVSLRRGHPLNADFLHAVLLSQPMPERDSTWSTFLQRQWKNSEDQNLSQEKRLIQWCIEGRADKLDEETLQLYGKTLGWMLSTPNRAVRDRATKALVAIFTNHLTAMHRLLFELEDIKIGKKIRSLCFLEVDDLYIIERLLAASYGAAMRSVQLEGLTELAQSVYDRYFKERNPVAHILVRDYARGIIEFALYKGCELRIDSNNLVPPYNSIWPPEPPTEAELKNLDGHTEHSEEEYTAQGEIYNSVMHGDFGRYTVGAQGGLSHWLSTPLSEQLPISWEERNELFKETLSDHQKTLLEKMNALPFIIRVIPAPPIITIEELENPEANNNPVIEVGCSDAVELPEDRSGDVATEDFLQSLSEEQLAEYQEIEKMGYGREEFSGEYALRWICHRAYQLGWNAKLHGQFDKYVNWGAGREETTSERIGKKYQRIAWAEFQTLLSDRYYFNGDEVKPRVLRGAWEIEARDIDPSIVTDNPVNPINKIWWKGEEYTGWRRDDPEWYRDDTDLPDPIRSVEVTDPETKIVWMNLRVIQNWDEPKNSTGERDGGRHPYAQIWYQMQSWIIPRDRLKEFKKWGKGRTFHGPLMPWIPELHECYFGEFHWSKSSKHRNPSDTVKPKNESDNLGFFQHTVNTKMVEGTLDYSLDHGTYHVSVPSKALVDLLELRRVSPHGQWADAIGEIIAFDPCLIHGGNKDTILVRKDALQAHLSQKGLAIVWTLLGEKQLMTRLSHWPKGIGRMVIGGYVTLEKGSLKSHLYTKMEGEDE